MNKYIRFLSDRKYRFKVLDEHGFYKNLPDDKYLEKRYKANFGKQLSLSHPITFNEKMQWLKVFDRKPIYSKMVDKFAVRKIVSERIGEDYLINLVGGPWDHFDDIDFAELPEQFVLKCTHDSGGLIICRDKASLDFKQARDKINASLSRNYYYHCREWPYKDVPPRIIAEKYEENTGYMCLPVYKFFCFGGEPYIIQTIQNDKQSNETIDYFDIHWNKLVMRQNFPNSKEPYKKPEKFEEMLRIASILSEEFAFIRVDLYSINGHIKFSEFTFYSDNGFAEFYPSEWDKKLGEKIHLPL